MAGSMYDIAHVDQMEGHEFERFIAGLLSKSGYQKVEVTPGSGDQGVDVLAEKDGVRYAFQCKCYSSDLGNTPVQEVNTGKMVYHCHVGVVVTNRCFTQSAREAAKATGVLLWDRTKLESLIAQANMEDSGEPAVQQNGESFTLWTGSPLLRRGGIALQDKEWKKASQFFDRVLNTDPENAEAYLGLMMAEAELSNQEAFVCAYVDHSKHLFGSYGNNLRRAKEFAGAELSGWFASLEEKAKTERTRRETEAKAEQERKKVEAEERRLQKSAKRFAAAKEQEQIVCDDKEPDALYAAAKVLRTAAQEFRLLGAYQDSSQRAEACEQRANSLEEKATAEIAAREEQERICKEAEAKERAVRNKKIRTILGSVAVVVIVVFLVITQFIIPRTNYHNAETLLAAGNMIEAAFEFGSLGTYKDARARSFMLWEKIAVRPTIAVGMGHTVGLKADGTVIVVGTNRERQCNVSGWQNIVALAAGREHTVGLKADGTVVATGDNYYGQCNISGWRNIVVVAAGDDNTVGVKADGTVVAIGENHDGQCNVSGWRDIIMVASGGDHTVGLKADGTVLAVGDNYRGQCETSEWEDIVMIAAGGGYTVGLKADGTALAVGWNDYGQCNVSGWKDIVAITAGGTHTIGLKSDGTAVATGENGFSQCDVSRWQDIVIVAAISGYHSCGHTVGLKADGTLVAVGSNGYGQCKVHSWMGIKVPEREIPNE